MDLYVVISGADYSVSDGTVATLQAHEGLGGSPLHRLRERGPMQHGETDTGYRLDPRIFSLRFLVEGSSRSNLDSKLATLLGYVKPQQDITFKFVLDSSEERAIDCHRIAASMGHDATKWWDGLPVGFQFSAADPAFYDPTAISEPLGLLVGTNAFDIPLDIPLNIGTDTLDHDRSLTYNGSLDAYPWRIRITGPVTDCVITNLTTDEKLDFTGATIADGDYYDIDCRFGQKTVKDSGGNNVVDDLTDDSDLATFHLAAAPDAPGGVNDFNVTGTAVDTGTEVYFNYYGMLDGLWG